MDGNRITRKWWVTGLIIAAIVFGCSASNRSGTVGTASLQTDAVISALTEDIEALYLAWRALDQVYKDIKYIERGFLLDADDRQLGYVQKTTLYVQDASLRIRHRWEQLAVVDYIRPERLRDYLTLSVNGLTSTNAQIGYDLTFMEIYTPFIDNEGVRQDLNRARDRIVASIVVLDRILQKLLPLANAAAPASRL